MTWLSFPLALFILLALVGSPAAETEGALETSWKVYQQRHILPDGRVVDDGNGGVSHSEGQGYALLWPRNWMSPPSSPGFGAGPITTCSSETMAWRLGATIRQKPADHRYQQCI